MWITAEMMADVYNQDAYSRGVAQEAIERYNSHIERCNRAIEAAEHGETLSGADTEIEQLRGELLRVAGERDTATRERDVAREELQKKSEILTDMSVRLEVLATKSGATSVSAQPAELRTTDPKLVTHINNLQEQLYAERHNNRRLKGA
jgi:chromosome segregation ATPase